MKGDESAQRKEGFTLFRMKCQVRLFLVFCDFWGSNRIESVVNVERCLGPRNDSKFSEMNLNEIIESLSLFILTLRLLTLPLQTPLIPPPDSRLTPRLRSPAS